MATRGWANIKPFTSFPQTKQATPAADGFDDEEPSYLSPINSPLPSNSLPDYEELSDEYDKAGNKTHNSGIAPTPDNAFHFSSDDAPAQNHTQPNKKKTKSDMEKTEQRKRKRDNSRTASLTTTKVTKPKEGNANGSAQVNGTESDVTPAKKKRLTGDGTSDSTNGHSSQSNSMKQAGMSSNYTYRAGSTVSRSEQKNAVLILDDDEVAAAKPKSSTSSSTPSAEAERRDSNHHPLESLVKEILNVPLYAVPQYLICPITRKVMKEPVFAEDGFTYEKSAVEQWIKSRLPPDTNNSDISVPGPNGDPISLTFIPNKKVRMEIERWRKQRKALKRYLRSSRSEPDTVKQLRVCFDKLRMLEQKNVEKMRSVVQIMNRLQSAERKREELDINDDERAERIAELERQIQELTRQIEELRNGPSSVCQEIDALRQGVLQTETMEIKANINNILEEAMMYRNQMQNLETINRELDEMFTGLGELSKDLRQKRDQGMQSALKLRKEVDELQEQLCQDIYRDAKAMEADDATRLEMMIHASELGSVEASVRVAKYYLMGEEYEEQSKAQPYLRRVIESGRSDDDIWMQKAHYLIGYSHRHGRGVPIDYKIAFENFSAAADHGHTKSLNCVGNFYNDGLYVEQNLDLAFNYFEKAASKGDLMGKYNLAILYQASSFSGFDEVHGFKLFLEIAEQMHDLDSMEEVIKCYRQGKGVAVDLEKASYWEERRDKEKAFQAGQA